MTFNKSFISLFLILLSYTSSAQCNVNTSICTSGTVGPFNFIPATSEVSTCLDFWNGVNAPNYVYIVLNITTSGPLNMLINANTTGGFVDVAVFNVPPGVAPCTAILNNANQIGCNYANAASGCNQFGTAFPCTSSIPAPNVVAGQTLMIVVEDWSNVQTSVTLQLGPLPSAQTGPPDATINPAGPFCTTSSTVQLTAADMGGVWSGPGTSATGSFNPSTAGIGTHTITYAIGAAPCNSSSTTTITVNPAPVAGTLSTPTTTFCGSTTVPLTLSGSAGTLQWQSASTSAGPWTDIPGATSPSYSPVVNTSTCFRVVVSGCGTPVTSNIVCVTINSLLTVNAGADVAICAGQTTILTGSGASTYSWNNGLGTGNGFSVSPTSTTTYVVSGTDDNGCVGTDELVVTINPLPVVNAGDDQTVCEGIAVTLSGSGATTYSWSNSVTNGVSFTQPVGSVNYTLTGADANGCVNIDNIQVTVLANPLPVITGPTQYCVVNPPLLSTIEPYTTYLWSTGETSSSSTVTEADNPITVTVTTAQGCSGTSAGYIVEEQQAYQTSGSISICSGQSAMIHGISQNTAGDYVGNYLSVLGCDSVSVITLNVNPLPPVFAGNDVVVCQGSGVILNASGANSYTWSGGVSNNVSFTPSVGTITYTVTGTSLNGCVNTDQVLVTVNSLPIVNAGNDFSLCEGQSATLSASGANEYLWSNGVSNGGAFIPIQTSNYTVTGTDVNGCVNTDVVTIVVNANPVVFAGNDLTICEGNSAVLTGSGASVYSWSGSVSNGVEFVPPVGTNTYTVTGTTVNGCVGTDQVNVVVDQAPSVDFSLDNAIGCVPHTINLTAIGADLNNCLWTSTSGNFVFNCGTAQMTIMQGGCFDITLTAASSSGCTESFTAYNVVCAEEAPNASFAVNPGSVSWTDPSVTMVNSTFGASDYLWYFGDNSQTSSEFQPEHTYIADVADNYTVMLLAYSPIGCVDTAYSIVEVYEDLIFYVPNTFTPDGDVYNQIFEPVFTSGFDPFDYQLLIFNRWGETVFESNDSSVGWDGTYGTGNQSGYVQDGTYVWRIEFKLKRNDSRKIVSGHVNVIR
jgi:trimeric autotransporter adhesin